MYFYLSFKFYLEIIMKKIPFHIGYLKKQIIYISIFNVFPLEKALQINWWIKKIKKKINISFYFENKKEDSQHIFGFLKRKKNFSYFLFSLFLLKIPKIKNQSELKLIFVSYLYLFIFIMFGKLMKSYYWELQGMQRKTWYYWSSILC